MAAAKRRKKKTVTSTRRSFWIVIAAVALVLIIYAQRGGGGPVQSAATLPPAAEGEIRVCFLDVGQGDSILIQTQDNAVLIDGGEYVTRQRVVSYLREAGVERLDFVVATHPHSDHIGGLPDVLNQFDVGYILMPDVIANTETFSKLLTAVESNGIPIFNPAPGELFTAGLIRLSTLAPIGDVSEISNLNNASLVFRMLHGNTAFLFTGDAEWPSEQNMIDSGADLRANILKAGHHGSNTSSADGFLDAVNPDVAVISCGKNNQYNHPGAELLESLAARGIQVYRTDELGSVIMSTNGSEILWYPGGGADE